MKKLEEIIKKYKLKNARITRLFDDYYIMIPLKTKNNNEYGLAMRIEKDTVYCKVYEINDTFNISKKIYECNISGLYAISSFLREKVELYNYFWYEILKLTKDKELINSEIKRLAGEELKEIILNFKEYISPKEVPIESLYLISNVKEIKKIYKWSKVVPENIHEIYKRFFKKGDIKSFKKIYKLFKVKEGDEVYELIKNGHIYAFKKICKNPNKDKIKELANYWAQKGNSYVIKKIKKYYGITPDKERIMEGIKKSKFQKEKLTKFLKKCYKSFS